MGPGDDVGGVFRRCILTSLLRKPDMEIRQPSIADRYKRQMDTFYSLPEKRYEKTEIRFSPSQAGVCSRQIYYDLTNTPVDEDLTRIPWQSRVPRVGDGLHIVNQQDLLQSERDLIEAGIPLQFRVKRIDGKPAIEYVAEREFEYGGEMFKIKGRLDAILEFIEPDGTVRDVVWDLKSKSQRKKLSPASIEKEIEKYKPQMVCYYLLTGIRDVLIEFESAQKDDWGKGEEAAVDEIYVGLEISDDDAVDVLDKFAYITRHIRENSPPDPERSYACQFCKWESRCLAKIMGVDADSK